MLKHEYQNVGFLGQSNSTQWASIELAWCTKWYERHWENKDVSILFLFSRNIQSLQRYQTQTLKPHRSVISNIQNKEVNLSHSPSVATYKSYTDPFTIGCVYIWFLSSIEYDSSGLILRIIISDYNTVNKTSQSFGF